MLGDSDLLEISYVIGDLDISFLNQVVSMFREAYLFKMTLFFNIVYYLRIII